jgi:phage tail sheath protein FI
MPLEVALADAESEAINSRGLNALRPFSNQGVVVWGARTLLGSDQAASDWKYVPVRRTALFIEESVDRGTQWAAFEPNAEPLWTRIRSSVSAFLYDLFEGGAFQGASPREAFFVKCDGQTTTQADIDLGLVNVLVGFAPLKPAEFVVLRISLRARAAS